MTPDERKARLEAARQALLTDDVPALLSALAQLPHDGTKAEQLRQQLSARLSVTQRPVAQRPKSGQTVAVKRGMVGGVQVAPARPGPVSIWHGGTSPLLRTSVRGGETIIQLNADHPIFPYLTRSGTLDDAASLLLLGWATLERDAGGQRRLERIRDMMTDWSRALAQIARSREESG